MIISLSGLIGSGKDTVADYLVNEYGFKRESFAGTLKDACASIFGWDRDMLEGKSELARNLRDQIDPWWAKRLNIPHLTPRWVLQHFGTDVCRKHFHNDIWLASLENKLQQSQVTNTSVVISDSRFMNELEMLSSVGATTIRVKRGPEPEWWEVAKKAQYVSSAVDTMTTLGIHRSEWDWASYNFDVVIANDSTLGDLYAKTKLVVVSTGQV
jgi:hypothetical protein